MIKKLLSILVLSLLLSGSAFANNLNGKQLECVSSSSHLLGYEYYKFTNNKDVKYLYIHKKSLEVVEKLFEYKVFPTIIEIHWGDLKMETISRKTLKTLSGDRCRIVKFDIKDHLKKQSNRLLEKTSKDNKI